MSTVNNDFFAECFNKSFLGDNANRARVKLDAKKAAEEIFKPVSEIPAETFRAYAKIMRPLLK